MIRRKIRSSYQSIRANFRDVADGQGAISHEDISQILQRHDVDMSQDQFFALLTGCGAAFEVSKTDEFCIKNEEFCIRNESFCIQNDGLCRTGA